MTLNDDEHKAFEKFCIETSLDRTMHPLHLLYLSKETHAALKVFKFGYAAAIALGESK